MLSSPLDTSKDLRSPASYLTSPGFPESLSRILVHSWIQQCLSGRSPSAKLWVRHQQHIGEAAETVPTLMKLLIANYNCRERDQNRCKEAKVLENAGIIIIIGLLGRMIK